MISKDKILLLVHARRILPENTWLNLAAKFNNLPSVSSDLLKDQVFSSISNADALWLLRHAFSELSAFAPQQISFILQTIDAVYCENRQTLEILWSGPSNGIFPVRRFDQVLYDLIAVASQRVLLVTFAAAKIDTLCSHLRTALNKGMQVSLILEAQAESEGQLSYDAIHAFGKIAKEGCRVYYWPLEKRERNAAGRPGKLHAKCAVVDNKAIVGSANLTDDAFNRNLELGLLVNNEWLSDQLFNHFKALIDSQVLRKFTP